MKLVDEVLDALRLQSTVFSRMTLAGDWGFAKGELQGAPFHLILSGRACLRAEGDNETLELGAGDVAILPRGERHRLLAHPEAEAVPWTQVIQHFGWNHWTPGTHFKAVDLRLGQGDPVTTLISGVFAFEDHRRNPLLAALPSVMHVRASEKTDAGRAVSSITSLLDTELLSGKPGAESVAGRLADILFIQVVRHHLADGDALPRGWLRGMADHEIGPALALIHGAPDRPWSVASLARELGMSRSRFAARFQEVVGQGPVDYLTHWRMYTAAGRLAEGKIALAKLAASVGYRSEVAFSKAFKRWAGLSPVEYRRSIHRDRTPTADVSLRHI
jgi:AraC-like DNA-binding protein